MIYFAEIGEGGPIKIGQSRYPWRRIEGLANLHKKNVVLLAEIAGGYEREFRILKQFAQYQIGNSEIFERNPILMGFIEKHKLIRPVLRVYRTKAESKRVPTLMTPDRIKLTGKLLNGGMSGPKIAKKLGVSTASVYGHWKQVGKGKFVRRRPKA